MYNLVFSSSDRKQSEIKSAQDYLGSKKSKKRRLTFKLTHHAAADANVLLPRRRGACSVSGVLPGGAWRRRLGSRYCNPKREHRKLPARDDSSPDGKELRNRIAPRRHAAPQLRRPIEARAPESSRRRTCCRAQWLRTTWYPRGGSCRLFLRLRATQQFPHAPWDRNREWCDCRRAPRFFLHAPAPRR